MNCRRCGHPMLEWWGYTIIRYECVPCHFVERFHRKRYRVRRVLGNVIPFRRYPKSTA